MTEDPSGRVFISYRRVDTRHIAGRLYDRLENRFGPNNVFMDVVSISPGHEYTEAIEEAVGLCDVVLALIGPEWLAATSENGQRQLDKPNDFVVMEISAGLDRGIPVIPVLVDGVASPQRHQLPGQIADLSRHQYLRIDHDSFDSDFGKLVTALMLIFESRPVAIAASGNSQVDWPSMLVFDGKPITLICSEVPYSEQSVLTEPGNPNYVALQRYGDLDALVEMYSHLRASNPTSLVSLRLASDVMADDLSTNIILLGGIGWNRATSRFQEALRVMPIYQVELPELATGDAFMVVTAEGERLQFLPIFEDSIEETSRELVEDVALLARLPNPFDSTKTLTLCNGIHSRGVLGAVRCLTDSRVWPANQGYLNRRFLDGRFGMLMRVPVLANYTLSPDLQNEMTRLYEWPA